jgi:predicted transcriptional regulator of viral defense system
MGRMPALGPKASSYRTESAHVALAAQREREIQALAARQHGVISLPQLQSAGLTASAVRNRVAAGKLQRLHQGVYVVGLAKPSREARYIAAVLACGPGAALSHRSAADLLGLRRCSRPTIEVTAPRRTGKSRPAIEVHRATGLEPRDVTYVNGIPCTTVARTLLDLAETLDQTALERTIERAETLKIFDLTAVVDVLNRAGNRKGAKTVRAALSSYLPEPAFTRSELEKRFLALCKEAGVPKPKVNTFGDGKEVDFRWPDVRLIAEVDSLRHHGTRAAFERDRRRDQELTMNGWRVVRFTWRQVVGDPEAVAATLVSLLGVERRGRDSNPRGS